MNVTDFTYLLQHPEKVVSPVQTNQLEDVLEEYPFFQAARALHLKGLKNLNSFKYNNALKLTAAHTADRDVLFDFITSEDFLQNDVATVLSNKSQKPLGTLETAPELPIPEQETQRETPNDATVGEDVTPVTAEEEITAPAMSETEVGDDGVSTVDEAETAEIPSQENEGFALEQVSFSLISESEDRPLPQSEEDAEKILDPHLFEPRKVLGIGEPIDFKKTEKHSFAQWLQLTSKGVEEESSKAHESPSTDQEQLKKKKFERIDTFIANNPKIVPTKDTVTEINVHEHIVIDPSELMTETLAKVYLEQKKYDKAIQAYTILSLKYPEKSGFFADRIKAVEQLKKENA
ncbi:MAG: hypothetical protein AB3N16_01440 [Flavobacteriaceae bacterium]